MPCLCPYAVSAVSVPKNMQPPLEKKKVALITGSGKRRVGSVVAEILANRGYQIALHYNRSAEEANRSVEGLCAQGVVRQSGTGCLAAVT